MCMYVDSSNVTLHKSNRAKQIKIHGTKYTAGAIVRVQTPSLLPYAYCQIQDIYIYHDHKIFKMEVMNITQYVEHLRAIEIEFTSQMLLATHNDFCGHGLLHLKKKGLHNYIIERELWFMHQQLLQ